MDLSLYSVLIIIDSEKELTISEVEKLKYEFEENRLSILIISDWNQEVIKNSIQIFDEEVFMEGRPNT